MYYSVLDFDNVEGHMCVYTHTHTQIYTGAEVIWGISASFSQFCCELKTALKKSIVKSGQENLNI